MKKLLIFILTVFYSTVSFSQNDIKKTESQSKKPGQILSKAYPTIKVGYMYSKWHSVEIGFDFLKPVGNWVELYGTTGLTIGSDFLFDNKVIFGPKLCAEANFLFLGTRLNATYFTADFKSGSLKIRPEIGLTLLGYANIFYGLTFNCTNPTYYKQRHSISVFFNIPVTR